MDNRVEQIHALMPRIAASRSSIRFEGGFVRKPNTCSRGADVMGSVHRLLGTSEGVTSSRTA